MALSTAQASSPLHQGRVALVTGASRGIGAATARLLAVEGAAVGVNFRHSCEAAEAVVAQIEGAGGRALAVRADVTDEDAVATMVDQVGSTLGPIDVLVLNAAGVTDPARVPFLEVPRRAIESTVLGQLRAVVVPSQAVLPGMLERGGGSLIVVSSETARKAHENLLAWSTAEAAIEGAARGRWPASSAPTVSGSMW